MSEEGIIEAATKSLDTVANKAKTISLGRFHKSTGV